MQGVPASATSRSSTNCSIASPISVRWRKHSYHWAGVGCCSRSWRSRGEPIPTPVVREPFFTTEEDGVALASQPGLLTRLPAVRRDEALERGFHSADNRADSWPLTLTPFRTVRQLLPNHHLELDGGEVQRFWPRQPLASQSPTVAAALCRTELTGTIDALVRRGNCALPLTGGIDSRALLAAAGENRERLRLTRVTGYHLPFYDALIPRKLARRIHAPLHVVRARRAPDSIRRFVSVNTSGLWWDPADYMIHSFRSIDCDYLLLGQCSEITRCFYYPSGDPPDQATAEWLAQQAKFGRNSIAIGEIDDWLQRLPESAMSLVADLFYWEHRVGNWAAMLATALDSFFTPVFPYNNRRLLATMLGLPTSLRASPYDFHQNLCVDLEPRFADVPYNRSLPDRLVASHWRIKRLVTQLRRRFSGFHGQASILS